MEQDPPMWAAVASVDDDESTPAECLVPVYVGKQHRALWYVAEAAYSSEPRGHFLLADDGHVPTLPPEAVSGEELATRAGIQTAQAWAAFVQLAINWADKPAGCTVQEVLSELRADELDVATVAAARSAGLPSAEELVSSWQQWQAALPQAGACSVQQSPSGRPGSWQATASQGHEAGEEEVEVRGSGEQAIMGGDPTQELLSAEELMRRRFRNVKGQDEEAVAKLRAERALLQLRSDVEAAGVEWVPADVEVVCERTRQGKWHVIFRVYGRRCDSRVAAVDAYLRKLVPKPKPVPKPTRLLQLLQSHRVAKTAEGVRQWLGAGAGAGAGEAASEGPSQSEGAQADAAPAPAAAVTAPANAASPAVEGVVTGHAGVQQLQRPVMGMWAGLGSSDKRASELAVDIEARAAPHELEGRYDTCMVKELGSSDALVHALRHLKAGLKEQGMPYVAEHWDVLCYRNSCNGGWQYAYCYLPAGLTFGKRGKALDRAYKLMLSGKVGRPEACNQAPAHAGVTSSARAGLATCNSPAGLTEAAGEAADDMQVAVEGPLPAGMMAVSAGRSHMGSAPRTPQLLPLTTSTSDGPSQDTNRKRPREVSPARPAGELDRPAKRAALDGVASPTPFPAVHQPQVPSGDVAMCPGEPGITTTLAAAGSVAGAVEGGGAGDLTPLPPLRVVGDRADVASQYAVFPALVTLLKQLGLQQAVPQLTARLRTHYSTDVGQRAFVHHYMALTAAVGVQDADYLREVLQDDWQLMV